MTWRDVTDPEDWADPRDHYGEALQDAELRGAFDAEDPEDRARDMMPGPLTRYADPLHDGPF